MKKKSGVLQKEVFAKATAAAKKAPAEKAAKKNTAARFAVGPGPDGGFLKTATDSQGNARSAELPPWWKPAIPASELGLEHTERLRELRAFSRGTVQAREQYLYLRLAYPYEAGLLLFENTDQVALKNDEDSEDDEDTRDAEF